ncbi:NAD-dependent epimerase/dehydratase family protein [Chromobacterium sp. IIBBL 290-4]|uniref:NAD-dependent epimerase/dehydratase family protein n=1 Tax=Chromobacterium sp. IIBBL 290-4 TaxID=2953890 RepID=UPI0020B688D6|nr:NAD-dependent epimerase/dehydratase family protein [Chromobacterium sp. IIBBL 290-4]UTH73476.1 NAD-dependent epimerase/dehydratase family protein [Chromobacterium sp. IIBBL 290-4]
MSDVPYCQMSEEVAVAGLAQAPVALNILIMGGTLFLGRHIVEAASARGHRLTLFNRGRQNDALFPDMEKLRGDRDADMSALQGRRFDVVIDPSAYRPEQVERLLRVLGEPPGLYVLVSTVSVYDGLPPGQPYDEARKRLSGGDGYGALKARAEDALTAALPGRYVIARPGVIVGPYDPTDRFSYWLRRLDLGGDVLAPGRPERPIQYVDARDLAAWLVALAERGQAGAFNVAGPVQPLSMGECLEACQAIAGAAARLHWVSDGEIADAGLAAWTELPFWLPEDDAVFGGIFMADSRQALAHGLSLRPLEQTIAETLAWLREAGETPESSVRVTPISAAREREVLRMRRRISV